MKDRTLTDIEIRLLLDGIHELSGLDFRNYARPFVRRRVLDVMEREGATTVSGLQERVLHDPQALVRFGLGMAVNSTSLFRDPAFYAEFRKSVVPLLRTYPSFRIWIAGCASGEEVYSLAMLLHEEGIYDRGTIYGTDMCPDLIAAAERGTMPVRLLDRNRRSYLRAGGHHSLDDAFELAGAGQAVLVPELRKNLVFSVHNLVTDSEFNEFQVVWCRNVMIYFDRPLQNRVHRLLHSSLGRLGVLGLGREETIEMTACADSYEVLDVREKLYRKVA